MLLKPIDPCSTCLGYNWGHQGYVPASGTGENGVLVIAEAAGEHEAVEGMPLVGKAGGYLFQQLERAGIVREGFRIHNVLSCRPPENKLSKQSYEDTVIAHCSPLLDATIADMQQKCRQSGKTFTIVTLGQIALRRVLGLLPKDAILREEYLCYPIWSEKYEAWVIAADHPSYLMRGQNHLIPVLQYAFTRALEIARDGLTLASPVYLLDPGPATFSQWIADYLRVLADQPTSTYLSYDIETPYKSGKSEEELANIEEGDDYQILRCSFSYKANESVSIPWRAEYLPMIEQLFASGGPKVGWNNANYDDPRIMRHLPINGDRHDAMLCWHVLNSALDKSLGFVTPFYVKNTGMWKHLSESQPAFYNAKDADMALQNFTGIKNDLEKANLWQVYEKHVVNLNRVLTYMSRKGVIRDEEMRSDAEKKLQDLLDVTELSMEASVPIAARKMKVYKKCPKSLEGLTAEEREFPVDVCASCGLLKPGRWKKHSTVCSGTDIVSLPMPQKVWLKPLEFKVSKLGLSNYQLALKHQSITDRITRKVTYDVSAIMKLIDKYPNDPLYPKILEHREYQKLLSTYIGITTDRGLRGGMPVGADGRIHTLFTHNPSTLRLASQNPNLQNLPRPSKDLNQLSNIIRNLVLAGPGQIFTARDYSGIEAVLVGFFALAPEYIRLAKMDVHSYYTAYALNSLDGRIQSADLPLLSWDDHTLRAHLAGIKREFSHDRNQLYKHLVHAINFGQGAKGAQAKIFLETGKQYPLKTISHVMGVYKELFPAIPRWHWNTLLQVEKDGYLRNPFGYVHRFLKPLDYEKIGGKWQKSQGPDANKAWAFLPQSTAAGIIKEALLRLFYDRFDEAGQYLRLQVHDEVFCEVPEASRDMVDAVMQIEMEKPVPELALPQSYKMGPYLSIDTEPKHGVRWGSMH